MLDVHRCCECGYVWQHVTTVCPKCKGKDVMVTKYDAASSDVEGFFEGSFPQIKASNEIED